MNSRKIVTEAQQSRTLPSERWTSVRKTSHKSSQFDSDATVFEVILSTFWPVLLTSTPEEGLEQEAASRS